MEANNYELSNKVNNKSFSIYYPIIAVYIEGMLILYR